MNTDASGHPHTILDAQAQALLARASGSISPQSVALAWLDWASHLATSPGKLAALSHLAVEQSTALTRYATQSALAAGSAALGRRGIAFGMSTTSQPEPLINDRRFRDPEWQNYPFNILHQAFLLNQHWWDTATRDVRGVDPHHADVIKD